MQAAQLPGRLNADIALLRERGSAESYSDRLNAAKETVERMRERFRRFGITRLADVTRLDRIGIPVWMAVRPNSKSLAVSQGKGLTHEAAQASALMEAAEIATAELCDVSVRVDALKDIVSGGEIAVPFNQLLSRGERPLEETESVAWLEGYDLIQERTAWVPADLVTLDPAGKTARPSRYWQSTDGLASGNALIEAVAHGLCERIERDASALWSFCSDDDILNGCIDPAALGDEAVSALAEQVDAAGFQLGLFDITSDVGVPVYFSTIAPKPNGHEHLWKHFDLSGGTGCHPSPVRAAIRAITEAAQSRVTSITGARDDFDPNLYGTQIRADLAPYVRAYPNARPAADPSAAPDSADVLDFMLERLRSAGIGSAIVVPLEVDSDGGFAVVRVLVPELENPPGNRRQRFGKRALRRMTGMQ